MLLQTNSYIVPKDKRAEHARLLRKFRQTLLRLGCDTFEVYEQVGNNWAMNQTSGRYVQIMRFRDRKHQLAVQQAEQADPVAREQIAEFCQLVNIPYQQQQGMFAVGFYTALLPVGPARSQETDPVAGSTGFPAGDPLSQTPPAAEHSSAPFASTSSANGEAPVVELPRNVIDLPPERFTSDDRTAASPDESQRGGSDHDAFDDLLQELEKPPSDPSH